MRLRLLDLFCGAGGAAAGYHRAGFEVIGVDINPQSSYPYSVWQRDALEWLKSEDLSRFVAIHASPPCQAFTRAQRLQKNNHPDLIAPLRPLLERSGLPYVIENVPGAPLFAPVKLAGTMFPGLGTERERWFETNWHLRAPSVRPLAPKHAKMGRPPKDGEWMHVVGNFSKVDLGREAMGIPWMSRVELAEAIPPAYTEFVGLQLRAYILGRQEAA